MKNNYYPTLKEHKFVVLGDDHYNPLGIVRSLGEIGVKPDVIVVGRNEHLISSSKYPATVTFVTDLDESLSLLRKNYIPKDHNKTFILTGGDDSTAILNEHYDELSEHFIFYNCGEQGLLNHLMQKSVQYKLAEVSGLNVAKTEMVKVGELPSKVNYPIMTKAVNSLTPNWKKNVFICHNQEELFDAYRQIDEEYILLQEYIVKKNELCIDAIAVNEGKDIYIPINSYYYRFFDNSYGLYYYFVQFNKPELLEKIKKVFEKTHFSGIFSIEFLVDRNDKLYFLEINFRNSTWSHASTRVGYNLVGSWCKSMLTNHIDTSDIVIPKLPYSCMVETSEFRTNVCKGRVSLWQFLKDVKHCNYFTYWDKRDNGPFWAIIRQMAKRALKKIFK